jgi:selenium-dependent xanthine dehydrogenase
MATFTVNGKPTHTDRDMPLIDYLRDTLRLTSVKNGCGEGACGACTILVDGKKLRACILTTKKADGKAVTTVEGLSPREQDVYAHCFAAAGAVQCGFCIPGMVLSAKALLDGNLNPTRAEVKQAIRGNICRCTGYVKIEDAILMAAEVFREGKPVPMAADDGLLGRDLHRVDAAAKVLGTGLFTDDIAVEGMIYAKALRSKHPRARVVKIDTSRASAMDGVVRVLTAKDVPFNKTGHLVPDWDVMIAEGDITRYIGDAVALVATRAPEQLDAALALIDVEYEVLTPVLTPAEGMAEGAPLLHEKGNLLSRQQLTRGDVDKAIAEAAYVVTQRYVTPQTDHAFMEPECAIAMPDGQGGIVLHTGSQSVYDEQREIARMLKLPNDKVRSVSSLVGGGFGGKEDMSVQHHAALMAWQTGLPVKVRFTRQESLNVHTKRHAMDIEMTTACDQKGNLTAMRALLISDCGAYASLGGPVLQRACTHAGGPYHFQNVDITGLCVYTNNVPGGAFRGFGVTQSCFAAEQNLNLLAEKVGLSAWEMRFKNAIRPGEVLPNGQIAGPDTAYEECLLAVKDAYESSPYAGIAGCMKNSGLGVGVPDFGRVAIEVRDGKAHILTSAACMGQGVATVCVQMACQTTGLPPSLIVHEAPDTGLTPNSGTSTASRQTLFTGEATRRAALQLKAALDEAGSLDALEGERYYAEFGEPTDPMGSDKPNPVSHLAYGYSAQVVVVDETKRVTRVVAAHDVGRVVNPKSCEGQVEGGVVMGLGFAFTEDFPMDAGHPTATYGKLGLWRATDVPPIEVKLIGKGTPQQNAFGAKGIGEITTIPTAPAAALACQRVDGKFRSSLPLADTAYRKA